MNVEILHTHKDSKMSKKCRTLSFFGTDPLVYKCIKLYECMKLYKYTKLYKCMQLYENINLYECMKLYKCRKLYKFMKHRSYSLQMFFPLVPVYMAEDLKHWLPPANNFIHRIIQNLFIHILIF